MEILRKLLFHKSVVDIVAKHINETKLFFSPAFHRSTPISVKCYSNSHSNCR